jgi:ABC-type Fe3+/spermidine/putrescine transport system ATPase subunit
VIEPLTLEIPDGAFVALLGPSGCGKTTLLRMVAGLEDPSSGEIRIGDRVVFAGAGGMGQAGVERVDAAGSGNSARAESAGGSGNLARAEGAGGSGNLARAEGACGSENLARAEGAGNAGNLARAKATEVNLPPEERGLGMVFQSYAVWPHMTVADNVAYPLRTRRHRAEPAERDRRVREALDLVRMGEYAARFPHQLSGGQQQRVALARGLAMKPPILLLDEPLSNLDARLRAEMRREIRDLHRRLGITILYVTHDQREAFEMSTHVVVLNEGRIAQQGAPDEVRSRPAPGFVAEFLALG